MSQNLSIDDKKKIDDLIKNLNATNNIIILNKIYPKRVDNNQKILKLLTSFSGDLLKFKQQGNQAMPAVQISGEDKLGSNVQISGQDKLGSNPERPEVNKTLITLKRI